jgi:TRAP-type mannitol/chloroaromatic compound transport system permease large subunit
MIGWIVAAGLAFGNVFAAVGGQRFIVDSLGAIGVNRWVILIGISVNLLVPGLPDGPLGHYDTVYPYFRAPDGLIGIQYHVVRRSVYYQYGTGFLTPPFGPNLFYMKGIVPKGVSTVDIYKSVIPFISLQVVALALCMAFPQIITYLPEVLLQR